MSARILYHGHSTLEIHAGAHRIQVDPFYTSNPAADVKADKVNPTHILITHAHGDHCEDALSIAQRTGALIASNYEITTYYEGKGAKKTLGMNHGGGANLPFGRITYTIAFHSSSFGDGTYGGQPGGWIVELPASVAGAKPLTIYFAGDTALFGDMKLIGELWNIDLACLPIGDTFTMGPAHAVKAAQFLRAKRVLPIHYNTWPPIAQDAAKFAADLKGQAGIECAALTAGQSIEL